LSSSRPQLVFGLTYHGSTPEPVQGLDNVFGKHISAAKLKRHLDWLKRRFRILTIGEILDQARRGTLPRRTAFIAFHDGYRSNYEVAFPILKQAGLQADFFIPTAFIGSGQRFWVDILDAALKNTAKSRLDLGINENTMRLSFESKSGRLEAAHTLRRYLKGLSQKDFEPEFQHTIGELGWSDAAQVPRLGKHEACMNWQQVREMAHAGMKFGSHTHRHLICATQDEETVRDELRISKKLIEDEIRKPCAIFCYPNGSYPDSGNDFTDRLAREAGYDAVLYMVSPYNLLDQNAFRLTGIALGEWIEFRKFKMALSPLRFRRYRWQKRRLWPWDGGQSGADQAAVDLGRNREHLELRSRICQPGERMPGYSSLEDDS